MPPHGALVLHQIIYDYLILYTYIYCQDARDLDIIVFFFLHIVLTLLSQAMYNLMMATTIAETCSC